MTWSCILHFLFIEMSFGNCRKWHYRDPTLQNFLGGHGPGSPYFGVPSGARYSCVRTPSKSHSTPLNPSIYFFERVFPRLEPTVCLVCVMIGQFEDSAITSNNFQCSPNNNGCSGFFNPRSLFKVTSTMCINTALLLTDNKRLRMHTAIFFSTIRVHLKGERS